MISRSSQYAIRALTYLAAQAGQGYHLVRTMASELGIPAPFLGKVLQPLVSCGLLASQRGRSGGFRLARPADEIRLLDVVCVLEDVGLERRCFLGQAECTDERACPLHEYWKGAWDDFVRCLTTTSFSDLVRFGATHPESAFPAPYDDRVASTGTRALFSTE